MKKNFISAIAGWKSAALLALVAMVAAVAFSGVLTNTQTADAQATPASAPAGSTVTVNYASVTGTADNPIRFRISPDSDGSATFSNGAQTITCYADSPAGCDSSTDSGIQLRVTIDDDSPLGAIYVQQVERTSGEYSLVSDGEHTITVIRANPPVVLKGYGAPAAASLTSTPNVAGDNTTPDETTIGMQLVNARGAGIVGSSVLVTTTRGVLNSTHIAGTATCTNLSACTLSTQAAGDGPDNTADTADDTPAGIIVFTLRGNGASGTAEVTARELVSGLSRKVSVVLHGPAAALSATVDQSTIGQGGSTFVVVSVSDAEGNPVTSVLDVDFQSNKPLVPAIVPPEVPEGSTANNLTYDLNVDRDLPGRANDLPACGDHPNEDDTGTTEVDESEGSLGVAAGTGTAGKCVIRVTAPAETGVGDGATRGTHTLTVGTDNVRIPTVNVEISVGGAPASIETDAPARVDSLSSTKITITVLDDEGVRVGAVPVSVVQVEGSGNADDVGGNMTSDGRGAFTFLAPLSAGEAVFLIRAGDAAKGQQIQDTVTIAIGEAPAEEPEGPAPTWNKELVSGQNLVVWNGADGADPSDGAAEGVSSIWSYNTGAGSWDGYFPNAADVPGGNTLTSLSNGDAYFVIVD